MNKYHKEILNKIKSKAKDGNFHYSQNYSGSSHPRYNINVPETRIICKEWCKGNKDIYLTEFIDLIDSLFNGISVDEKKLGGYLLSYFPNLRKQININNLDSWLEKLEGWEEIDTLCQSTFTYKEQLDNWNLWVKKLRDLSKNESLVKQRASLVLLTGSVSKTDDKRLSQIAFENIDRLKDRKEILITKAVSWLLRDLVKNFRNEVIQYLKENKDTLPKIAIRETNTKILKGKKT